ncbi:MAG TPA: hypothetical protein ACFYD3_05550 [Candidatus Hypogeohydataceae bacterium YC41]
MNLLVLLFPFVLAFFCGGASLAAEEDLKARVETMEKELQILKAALTKQEEKATKDQALITELEEQNNQQTKKIEEISQAHEVLEKKFTLEEFYFPKKSQEFYGKDLSPQFSGIYTKPFLRRAGRNTYLGGYMDASYRMQQSGKDRFEVLRFVPFIYADVSDRVKVASEIEFEHGGAAEKEGVRGDAATDVNGKSVPILDGEAKLEFATIDFQIKEWINMRAGIILVPLGKFNLVHDAPLQELVDRPLVDTFIIPTTLSQAGMGFFGTLYPTEMSKLDYEIYATNGFGNDINSSQGLMEARLFRFDRDNNSNPALVTRVGFSPFLGLEVGGSVLFNKFSSTGEGKSNFVLPALDFAYQKGPFELVGEGAVVLLDRGQIVKSEEEVPPSNMFGYYVEPRFHFMPKFLRELAPKIFTERSTFTLVGRWDQVDLGNGFTVGEGKPADRRRQRATIGLNYRYTRDTVFKVDYEWNIEQSGHDRTNNVFVFGWATYF